MAKRIVEGQAAKDALLEGSRILTGAVATTLGPRGNNVAYARPFGTPGVVHDGVTVAKEVDDPRPEIHTAIELLKEPARKTDDQTGDGTTTAIVLTDAILTEGIKLTAAGHNPMMLRRGIEPAIEALVAELRNMATEVTTDEEITQVAYISAQNAEIGSIIAAAVKKLGREAVITVEESNATDISVEYKDGMEFDQGFISPLFQTDPELGEAVVVDAHILITDKHLGDINELVELFTALEKAGVKNNVVVIAGDVTGQVLGSILANKLGINGAPQLNLLAVKAPGFGEKQRDVLVDIAALTGGKFISAETGEKFEDMDMLAALGRAKRVVATKDNTTIVEGSGDPEVIHARIQTIKNQMQKSEIGEFDLEKLKERLAKLTTGIAIISVGAPSEAEMKEKKERIIDAISATRAALEEGIVPGGETALLRASHVLGAVKAKLTDEEGYGVDLVARAITQPFRRLMTNSGFDAGEKYALFAPTPLKGSEGIDVMDGKLKDLVAAGVVDPIKVTRCALANAASTATTLLTVSHLIVEDKKDNEDQ